MTSDFEHLRVSSGHPLEVALLDAHVLDEGLIRSIQAEIDRVLEAADTQSMVLDFSAVEHLSSSALGMLITINTRIQAKGGELCLANIADPIAEVFRITRLDRVLQLYPDVQTGRSALTQD